MAAEARFLMRFSLGFLMRALYAPGGRVSRARAQLRAAAACGGGCAKPQEVLKSVEKRDLSGDRHPVPYGPHAVLSC